MTRLIVMRKTNSSLLFINSTLVIYAASTFFIILFFHTVVWNVYLFSVEQAALNFYMHHQRVWSLEVAQILVLVNSFLFPGKFRQKYAAEHPPQGILLTTLSPFPPSVRWPLDKVPIMLKPKECTILIPAFMQNLVIRRIGCLTVQHNKIFVFLSLYVHASSPYKLCHVFHFCTRAVDIWTVSSPIMFIHSSWRNSPLRTLRTRGKKPITAPDLVFMSCLDT